MKKQLVLLTSVFAVLLYTSCASTTQRDGVDDLQEDAVTTAASATADDISESDGGEVSRIETATAQTADYEATEDAGTETETADANESGDANSRGEASASDAGKIDTTGIASAAGESAETAGQPAAGSIPAIEMTVSPENPSVGETVSVTVNSELYDTVVYDFGDGPAMEGSHEYKSFGIKTVAVSATIGEQSISGEVNFPVFAGTEIILETDKVQHDASWKPVVRARLETDGDFDLIRIFENDIQLFEITAPEEYLIPVPFTGERTFTADLYHRGFLVAEIAAVAVTGLNSPPAKPVYDGPQFITARPGEEVRFSVSAADPNNDPVSYEVKFAPVDAVFDGDAGVFSWTPGSDQRGVYLLHITAIDIPYGLSSPFIQRGIMVQ